MDNAGHFSARNFNYIVSWTIARGDKDMELYLLGGRPCSGKTTLSYYLGQKHKIEVKYLDVFSQISLKMKHCT